MKLSAAKKQAFCEALVRGHTPDTAARSVGVSRATVYAWKVADAAFSAAWDDARERKIEAVENVLYRKAIAGEAWAVCYFLRGHRPELFNRRQLIGIGGDADAPPVGVHQTGARDNVIFYYPENFRGQPEPDDEAELGGEAAA